MTSSLYLFLPLRQSAKNKPPAGLLGNCASSGNGFKLDSGDSSSSSPSSFPSCSCSEIDTCSLRSVCSSWWWSIGLRLWGDASGSGVCLWLTDSCDWEAVVAVEVFCEEVKGEEVEGEEEEGEEEEGKRRGRRSGRGRGGGGMVDLYYAREIQLL